MFKRLTIEEFGDFIDNQKKRKISKKEICQKIGMTENGLFKAIKQESMKLTTFQDICEVTQTHPSTFFLTETQTIQDTEKDTLSMASEAFAVYETEGSEAVPRFAYDQMKARLVDEINYLRSLIVINSSGDAKKNK
jgi:hypothetical protein